MELKLGIMSLSIFPNIPSINILIGNSVSLVGSEEKYIFNIIGFEESKNRHEFDDTPSANPWY